MNTPTRSPCTPRQCGGVGRLHCGPPSLNTCQAISWTTFQQDPAVMKAEFNEVKWNVQNYMLRSVGSKITSTKPIEHRPHERLDCC